MELRRGCLTYLVYICVCSSGSWLSPHLPNLLLSYHESRPFLSTVDATATVSANDDEDYDYNEDYRPSPTGSPLHTLAADKAIY
jgi:hypothetical protein